MENGAPIDVKVLAGRADNESPIHIGSIATLFEIITNERTGSNQ